MTTFSDARHSPRRAPAPGQRQVDADRTRAALLDAALEEFAAKGFAGTGASPEMPRYSALLDARAMP